MAKQQQTCSWHHITSDLLEMCCYPLLVAGITKALTCRKLCLSLQILEPDIWQLIFVGYFPVSSLDVLNWMNKEKAGACRGALLVACLRILSL